MYLKSTIASLALLIGVFGVNAIVLPLHIYTNNNGTVITNISFLQKTSKVPTFIKPKFGTRAWVSWNVLATQREIYDIAFYSVPWVWENEFWRFRDSAFICAIGICAAYLMRIRSRREHPNEILNHDSLKGGACL